MKNSYLKYLDFIFEIQFAFILSFHIIFPFYSGFLFPKIHPYQLTTHTHYAVYSHTQE